MSKAKKINIKGYQVEIDGKAVMVKDLTVEQLQQELCRSINYLEAVDVLNDSINEVVRAFRFGRDYKPRRRSI